MLHEPLQPLTEHNEKNHNHRKVDETQGVRSPAAGVRPPGIGIRRGEEGGNSDKNSGKDSDSDSGFGSLFKKGQITRLGLGELIRGNRI